MPICKEHWDRLRELLDERGLSGFVPDSGEQAMKQQVDQMESGKTTVDNFDPLARGLGGALMVGGELSRPQSLTTCHPRAREARAESGPKGKQAPRTPLSRGIGGRRRGPELAIVSGRRLAEVGA